MPANTSMQGTYIPQYTQVPATSISVEVSTSLSLFLALSLEQHHVLWNSHLWIWSLPPPSQESAIQQPVAIETPTEHTTYSYQHNKWRGGRGELWSCSVLLYILIFKVWELKDWPRLPWLRFLIGCSCVRSSSGAGATLKRAQVLKLGTGTLHERHQALGGGDMDCYTERTTTKKKDIFYKLIF